MEVTLHVDGGSRGNPGRAAIGVVVNIEYEDGSAKFTLAERVPKATNNVAEYLALIRALEWLLLNREDHIWKVKAFTDSQVMAHQVNGIYQVQSLGLKELHTKVVELSSEFRTFSLTHIPREQNAEADALVNQAFDWRQDAIQK